MNRVNVIAVLILIGCTAAYAGDIGYEIGIDGLACPFCAYGIEKQLRKLDGVAGLEVDLAQGVVTIRMNEGKVLTGAEAEKAVKKAGFKLRSFSQTQ